MPLVEVRLQNYKAFKDTGIVRIGPVTAFIGKNDVGKSALLHALALFFNPPRTGGIPVTDIHGLDSTSEAVIELAFDPMKLQTTDIQLDAKNICHIINDFLVDDNGLFRLRMKASPKGITAFEICINDIDQDDAFPLGLKKEDVLLSLLESRGLEATKAGKETNKEKRNRIREHDITAGIGMKVEWVDTSDYKNVIRGVLPEFVFFQDTARFGVGETPVQSQFKGVVERALSSNPRAAEIEDDIEEALQEEFNKVYERLANLTDSVTGMTAHPKVSWKKAVDGIALNWSDATGISIPYESRGAGVRRLFMVAYLQYEAAEALYSPDGPRYLFCVEEPELHLHPEAQRLLESVFSDLGNLGHGVLFTTHSPVFAATVPLDNLVLVTRDGIEAQVSVYPRFNMKAVAEEIGVDASDRLVGKNNVVLVEGKQDAGFLSGALEELHEAGVIDLDPNEILFLQCGGINNLQYQATTQCIDEAGLRWALVLDSDRVRAGDPASEIATNLSDTPPTTCLEVCVLERTAMKNYFDKDVIKVVTGIDCLVPQYGKLTNSKGRKLSSSGYNLIKTNAKEIAHEMGPTGLQDCSKSADGRSELVTIFGRLKTAFNI